MGAKSKELLCFLHIEKAAGTTLHRILQANFGSYVSLSPHWWPGEESDVFRAGEAAVLFRLLPFASAFGGHPVRSYLGYEEAIGRPIRYITFLREPAARYLSHYHHHRRRGWARTFREFAAEPRYANLMTKKVAGCYDVAAAKKMLAERFAFVGLVERFDESLHLLRSELSVPDFRIGFTKANVSADTGYRDSAELSEPWVADAVAEANQLDRELYRFAFEELWPAYRARYVGSLEDDLRCFGDERPGLEVPAAYLASQRAFRLLGYRNLEMVLRGVYHADSPDLQSRIARVVAGVTRAIRRASRERREQLG